MRLRRLSFVGFNEYLISDHGEIYSEHGIERRKLRPKKKKDGRRTIVLCDGADKRREMSINILVALAFIDNPLNKRMVHHIDGNRDNLHYKNLSWGLKKRV